MNGVIDAVYAGDLLGNMWKFDVSSSDKTKWKVAYGTTATPAPLYTACNDATTTASCDASRQAITNLPQVDNVGSTQTSTGGVMVYFGTGKYFEDSDNLVTNTKTQSFYGIWDKCLLDFKSDGITANPSKVASNCASTVPKTTLVQQSILVQLAPTVAIPVNVRVTSANTVNYSTKNGWYMDFVNPNPDTTVPPNPNGNNQGERIVSASLLRNGRIIFTTLIPVPPKVTTDPNALCTAGSQSTSWLTILDAISGSRTLTPTFDINGNGSVTSTDVVSTYTVTLPDGTTINPPASGIQMTNSSKTPNIMINPNTSSNPNSNPCPVGTVSAIGYLGDSSGQNPKGIPVCLPGSSTTGASRQSWRQL
jgi:type IV pilus assembly protein PilY1